MSAHPDLVGLRDALCNADNEADFILNGLDDSVSSERWWHVEDSGIGLRVANGLRNALQRTAGRIRDCIRTSFTVPNTGRPRCVWPALLGDTPPTIFVPYARASLTWKVP